MTNRLHQALPIHFTTHHHFQYFHPTLPLVCYQFTCHQPLRNANKYFTPKLQTRSVAVCVAYIKRQRSSNKLLQCFKLCRYWFFARVTVGSDCIAPKSRCSSEFPQNHEL